MLSAPTNLTNEERSFRTPVENALIHALLRFVDLVAYGTEVNGERSQVSRIALERHFTALYAKQFDDQRISPHDLVKKLTGNDIVNHQRGTKKLFVRSYWCGGRLLVRLDVDEHNNETDGQAFIEWFKATYFPLMYVCKSKNGWSGYFWLEIPKTIDTESGEEKPVVTMMEMNAFRVQLHEIARALAKDHGYRCGVEVHGSFLKKVQERNEHDMPIEPPTIPNGAMGTGTTCRLPTVETLDDVECLSNAVLKCNPRALKLGITTGTDPGIVKLLADSVGAIARQNAAKALAKIAENRSAVLDMSDERIDAALGAEVFNPDNPEQVQRILDCKPARKPGQRTKATRVITLKDPNDKVEAARASIVCARLFLGIQTKSDLAARKCEVLEEAHKLYDENQLSHNQRDLKRDKRLLSAFDFILRNFDDSKSGAGNDPFWIDVSKHILELTIKLVSTAGVWPAMLEFNQSEKGKKTRKLTLEIIAMVAAIMAKNATVGKGGQPSAGDVPNLSISRLLAHPNFLGVQIHNSVIAAAKRIILTHTNALTMIAPAAAPSTYEFLPNGTFKKMAGRAARYRVTGLRWFSFLPQAAMVEKPVNHSEQASGGILYFFTPKYKGCPTTDMPEYKHQYEGDPSFSGPFHDFIAQNEEFAAF